MKIVRISVFLLAVLLLFWSASSVSARKPSRSPQGTSIAITVPDTNQQDLSNGQTHTFRFIVQNTSNDTEIIFVQRSEALAPGWTTSICDPQTCHDAKDSLVPWALPPAHSGDFTLNMNPVLDDQPDSTSVSLAIGISGSPSDTILRFFGTSKPGTPPLIFSWNSLVTEKTYSGSGIYALTNFLDNVSGRTVDFALTIQDSVPSGWSLSICNGVPDDQGNINDNCSVGTAFTSIFSPYLGTAYEQRLKFKLNAPTVTKEDSAVIYVSVHPKTNNPADSANYRFVMRVQPQSDVAVPGSDDRAGLTVTNAWPNPVYHGARLHLDVLTDREGAALATIYDVAGTRQSAVNIGTLEEGENHLQVEIPSLPSGEYIVRIDQGTVSSEA